MRPLHEYACWCSCGRCGSWAVRVGRMYVGIDGFLANDRINAWRTLRCDARAIARWWKDAGHKDVRVIRFKPATKPAAQRGGTDGA